MTSVARNAMSARHQVTWSSHTRFPTRSPSFSTPFVALVRHAESNHSRITESLGNRDPRGCGSVRASLRSEAEIISAPLTSEFHEHGDSPCRNDLVLKSDLLSLENELSRGEAIKALADFNNALRHLDRSNWEAKLKPVFKEWCFNLESFNPAFAAVLLQVQLSIGKSDYYHRDNCLRCLIQPLAGEYGMHNNEPQGKTHRLLFKEFFESLFPDSSLDVLLESEPPHGKTLFQKMIHDIQSHGNDPIERASYALGYNLAIEYLADYEKRWMLQSFRQLASAVIQRDIAWLFLDIHAEDEKEHAAIGHEAVLSFVPSSHLALLRNAMQDHDRDFAVFYNHLASMLK